MRWNNCRLSVIIVLSFQFTISQSQYICNDTYGWINGYNHPCSDYAHISPVGWGWCPNGTYTLSTTWTGGNPYKYPEFNCCACGKGWPLWFVPAVGYTAEEAVPKIQQYLTNNLMCHDTYKNATMCTMKCKTLQGNTNVTSLATIAANDFNTTNCTLDFSTDTNGLQYVLQIPISNYLIYFTNWTTSQYNITCANSTGLMTSNMICRYEVVNGPVQSPLCPSNKITNRYIPPNCVDTKNWTNLSGYTCFEYEVTQGWCTNGQVTVYSTLGEIHNYPERNCCACGKGLLSLKQSPSMSTTNNPINSSEFNIIQLKNCTSSKNANYFFNIKCLAPIDFINTNITMNTTFYNCPLDCFFNWNTTQINPLQSMNVSRQSNELSIMYYLTSTLLYQNRITCGLLPDIQITTVQSTVVTDNPSTTKLPETSVQSTVVTDNPSTTKLPGTTGQAAVWHLEDRTTEQQFESTLENFAIPTVVIVNQGIALPIDNTSLSSSNTDSSKKSTDNLLN